MQNTNPFLQELLRNVENDNWFIISILVLGTAYVSVSLVYNRYWRRYRQALFYNQEAQKLLHEKNVLLMQAAIIMNLLGAFSLGLFAYLFSVHFDIWGNLPENFSGWMLATLFVILLFGGKFLINQFIGSAADNINAATIINHQWMINFKTFGFFLLPITIVAAFSNSPLNTIALYFGLSLIIFMLIINYIKAFLILFQNRISIYYGILYLCTLEILPVLIVWKVIRF